MYTEEILNQPVVYSLWKARICRNDPVYPEQANRRWGFVCKEWQDASRDAYIVGPSASFYDFRERSESYTCWGVELHEFVESDFIDKVLLHGSVRKITGGRGMMGGTLRLGDRSFPIPMYDGLLTFVADLQTNGFLRINRAAESALAGESPLSKRSRQRIVRGATGLSMTQIELIEYAEHAVGLLRRSVPAVTAAVDSGFFDQSHLTKVVKRTTGKTPGQFSPPR